MSFKIYTKTGDTGDTSLFGGKRLPKSHVRIESYGTIDELNAFLGLIRDSVAAERVRALLKDIQDRLFDIGAYLAMDPDKEMPASGIRDADIEQLEKAIDEADKELPELKNFILPGGHPTVSYCHIARCVCRRAERRVVALAGEEKVDGRVIRYLNRLSDFLFVLARKLSKDLGVEEVKWTARK